RPIIDLTLSHPIKKINISILSLGNPHVIVFLDTIDTTLPNELAPLIASHPLFPESVNIGFMQIMNRNTIRLRTFERGVGETLACGSNATAAVFAGLINNFLDEKTNVQFQRGQLTIEWNSNSQTISMTGPAAHVFDGEIK
ncbi:MAG: diaminopimelate epimerase, partial [Gammaproteobacteria bacterium RIFCSPHIGHO2_12_FULL_38_14]